MISQQAAAAGISVLQVWAIYLTAAAAILIAHVHSFREALQTVRTAGRRWPSWGFVVALVAQHELNYAKRVPMLVLLVITTVIVTIQF